MTTDEKRDQRLESFRCSGLVRRAVTVLVMSHQERIWPVSEQPFAKVPTMMAFNLGQIRPSEEVMAAAALFGIGDRGSPCPDDLAESFCESTVTRIHYKASWTEFAKRVEAESVYGWSDMLSRWRGYLERTPPPALLVIAAYEHYLLTTLNDMCEQTNDPTVWQRWYLGFPPPYNQFAMPKNPYLALLEHYRGHPRSSRGATDGWVGVLKILSQRLGVGRGLLDTMKMIVRGLDTTFRTAGLI